MSVKADLKETLEFGGQTVAGDLIVMASGPLCSLVLSFPHLQYVGGTFGIFVSSVQQLVRFYFHDATFFLLHDYFFSDEQARSGATVSVAAPSLQIAGSIEISGTDINATHGDVGFIREATIGDDHHAIIVHGVVRVATSTRAETVCALSSMDGSEASTRQGGARDNIGAVKISNLVSAGALWISSPIGSIGFVSISTWGDRALMVSSPLASLPSSYFQQGANAMGKGVIIDIPLQDPGNLSTCAANPPSIAHVSIQGLRMADALEIVAGRGAISRIEINTDIAVSADFTVLSSVSIRYVPCPGPCTTCSHYCPPFVAKATFISHLPRSHSFHAGLVSVRVEGLSHAQSVLFDVQGSLHAPIPTLATGILAIRC